MGDIRRPLMHSTLPFLWFNWHQWVHTFAWDSICAWGNNYSLALLTSIQDMQLQATILQRTDVVKKLKYLAFSSMSYFNQRHPNLQFVGTCVVRFCCCVVCCLFVFNLSTENIHIFKGIPLLDRNSSTLIHCRYKCWNNMGSTKHM